MTKEVEELREVEIHKIREQLIKGEESIEEKGYVKETAIATGRI